MESCQQTVPEAMTAFLEGENFEDVIRTAVSLGGDCDTLTAIAGSIAEAFYGIPAELKREAYNYLDQELNAVLADFEVRCHFREEVAQKYHPLYWFNKDADGFVQLCRPFGAPLMLTECREGFYASEEDFENWQREKLYEKVFGAWDGETKAE